jgi:hypothetical protein
MSVLSKAAIEPFSVYESSIPRSTATGDFGLGKWKEYFGEPPFEYKPNVYEDLARNINDLPEAYFGRNVFLEHTVKGVLVREIEWYTGYALPWLETNEHHFSWSEWTAHRRLAGRTPNQASSRTITSSKKTRSVSPLRRGLSMHLESEYMGTPDGDEQYRNMLQAIVSSIIETAYFDTMLTLLEANNPRQKWKLQYGLNQLPLSDEFEHEATTTACINKDPKNFAMLIQRYRRMLMKMGIIPDLLITSPETIQFMDKLNAEPREIPYFLVGEGGQLLRKNGPMSIATTPDGTHTVESRDLVEDEDAPKIQPLTNTMSVGEFLTMFYDHAKLAKVPTFKTSMRDLFGYNGETDKLERITFREAFEHGKWFEKDILLYMIDNGGLSRSDFITPSCKNDPSFNDSRNNRGIDLENLLDLSNEQLMDLVHARARRRFSNRGLKRKPGGPHHPRQGARPTAQLRQHPPQRPQGHGEPGERPLRPGLLQEADRGQHRPEHRPVYPRVCRRSPRRRRARAHRVRRSLGF